MTLIPRGVSDDRELAVVHDADGVLVALDPTTGTVRWRRGRGLRPCALTVGSVVAVSCDDPAGLTVHLLGRDDGREQWSAPAVVLPDWARPALDNTPQFQLAGTVDGDGVVLRWTATSTYAGGAAPGAAVVERHTRNAAGAVRIDLVDRSVDVVDVPVEAAVAPAPDGPVGALRVELAVATRTGTADAVVLRGVDAAAGDVQWQLTLDEVSPRRPPPLRQ